MARWSLLKVTLYAFFVVVLLVPSACLCPDLNQTLELMSLVTCNEEVSHVPAAIFVETR
jgi:hypothetical protein